MSDKELDGDDLLPEQKLLVSLIPHVGGPLATYLQDRRDRQIKRTVEFQQAALSDATMEPGKFLERIADDERLSELFFWGASQRSGERDRLTPSA